MDFMFDWEGEGDRFSFEDSDRFEEDSLCSWISEPESLCNNWRGWRRQNGGQLLQMGRTEEGQVTSLLELSAQAVAGSIAFEEVEHFYPPIPEQLQLRIAFWSFPENEEDIRLYSCLANGSADEFQKGEHLFKAKAVKEPLQIGFHLSATIVPPQQIAQAKGHFNVSVVFDRRRVTSSDCSCGSQASWCCHVVALCLFRIHQHPQVTLRAPVSESLSRLQRDQLQKFAQYLISELPQQILPTAQRLLDELLSTQQTAINTVCGAPDPTAGPSANEVTRWNLDETTLHDNIKKTLIKFCVPSPTVFSDVTYLSSTAPPAASEWQSLLRPMRGREPEGMWNLLSIVREMYRRHDSNAIPLLEILTDEILSMEQIMMWWFQTKISATHNAAGGHANRSTHNASCSSQHAASSLCDEIVTLWRLAALNPSLSPIQRDDLETQLKDWHIKTIDKVRKARNTNPLSNNNANNNNIKKSDIEVFSGFKSAIEACQLDWCAYEIVGITYVDKYPLQWHFSFGKAQETDPRKATRPRTSQVSGCAMKSTDGPLGHLFHLKSQEYRVSDPIHTDGSSSEGFCDTDRHGSKDILHDSDSDLGADIGDSTNNTTSKLSLSSSSNSRKLSTNCGSTAKVGESCNGVGKPSGTAGLQIPAHVKVMKSDDMDCDEPLSGASNQVAEPNNHAAASNEGAAAAVGGVAAARAECADVQQANADEYQMYFYDTRSSNFLAVDLNKDKDKKKKEEPNYFAGIKKIDNSQDILFARAEALHAHGHTKEACELARSLAEEMLNNPPDLTSDAQQNGSVKGKKAKKNQSNISSFASSTLAKAAFLCTVLLEEPDCHHLAFRVGLFGLEMPRPPASSKALEVKLAYQESELVTLLKKIPLGAQEMSVIRDRAEKLRDGKLKSRGEALLPLMLASFIFDSLCLPSFMYQPVCRTGTKQSACGVKLATDEKLGCDACVAALGLKANASEADHPLLCEGTRRQRGELLVAMIVHYKDDQLKLSKVMDKLLDKEVHQLYKAPSLSTYLSSKAAAAAQKQATNTPALQPPTANRAAGQAAGLAAEAAGALQLRDGKSPSSGCESDDNMSLRGDTPRSTHGAITTGELQPLVVTGSDLSTHGIGMWEDPAVSGEQRAQSLAYLNLEGRFSHLHLEPGSSARPCPAMLNRCSSKDTDGSAVEDEATPSDYKAWEAKFRCTNLKTTKKPSVGMASIDSSAPETTSSDNSPTLERRNMFHRHGPGSDSGSSGKSSDSLGSSMSGDKLAAKLRDDDSPAPFEMRFSQPLMMYSRSSTPGVKNGRFKGKKSGVMPTVPNQPSEATAHFMFELAKTVLTKAGGTSSTSLFTQPTQNNNPTGPHRNLHLCAFQIGLYALGLHNCVSPNWLSRTYSSHVSWITGQAMEIGSAAINILIDTWEGHLTPQEVASLADRASRCREENMVRASADLALSCLPHAQALNPNEIQRALLQCKEQTREKLERACLAVESASKGGGVYPDVLFDVAKRWYELYEEASVGGRSHAAAAQASNAHVPIVIARDDSDALLPAAPLECHEPNPPPLMQLIPSQQLPTHTAAAMIPLQAPPGGLPPGAMAMAGPGSVAYPLPPPNPHTSMPHHPYIAPYSYVQAVQPNYAHHYSAPHIPLHTHSIHPSYMASYPYQNPATGFINVNLPPGQNTTTIYHANISHLRPPALQMFVNGQAPRLPQVVQQSQFAGQSLEQHVAVSQAAALVVQPAAIHLQQPLVNQQGLIVNHHVAPQQPGEAHTAQQVHYLQAAYRVGMLAMETLARKVHEDRPQTKYAKNPPNGEDVKWLLHISFKLGHTYVQQFCVSAGNAVFSPFLLQEIAYQSALYMARTNNPAQVQAQLRSPTLNSLIQKCLQMYTQCTHQRMHHIAPADYDEFVSVVCHARTAFCMTPGGPVQFNELLQSLRRSKSCKKELWQRIVNGLATGKI